MVAFRAQIGARETSTACCKKRSSFKILNVSARHAYIIPALRNHIADFVKLFYFGCRHMIKLNHGNKRVKVFAYQAAKGGALGDGGVFDVGKSIFGRKNK